MTFKQLLASCPPEADINKFLEGHIKGMYKGHLSYLRLAHDKGNPLQPDAVEWLLEAKELATAILDSNITLNHFLGNQLAILARLNVSREMIIQREQAKVTARAAAHNNHATVWRTIDNR